MSSEALEEGEEKSHGREGYLKQVEEMVEQMRNVESFDWEDDVNDPFEKVVVKKERTTNARPKSAEENVRHIGGCDRGTGSGRFQRSRGNFLRQGSLQSHKSQQESDSGSEIDSREFREHRTWRKPGRHFRNRPGRGNRRGANTRQCGYSGNYNSDNHSTDGVSINREEENCSPRGFHGDRSEGIRPWLLVEALSECPGFRASLLQLFEWKNMHPTAVREVVMSNGQIFSLNGESVELSPKISICSAHSGSQGCQNRLLCKDLHICPIYVKSWCQDRSCVFGHKWFTEHNTAIFQSFYLERLPYQSIKNLMMGLTKANKPSGQLDVCLHYNGKGCSNTNCGALHICHNFLTKCTLPGCRLNHDLLSPECCNLLRAHGFSTNEAPRDVALALHAANPSLASANPARLPSTATSTSSKTPATIASISNDNQQGTGATADGKSNGTGIFSLLKQKIITGSSDKHDDAGLLPHKNRGDSANRNNIGASDGDQKNATKRKDGTDRAVRNSKNDRDSASNKFSPVVKTEKHQTVWSHYLFGDTEINEICFYSVETMCKYESTGCKRLHSAHHFHWQISEQGSKWLNLRSFQVDCLERAFCDPAKDGETVPRLDPAKLDPSVNKLLTVLGRDNWQANFQSMIMANSNHSKILYLRRLCTEHIAGKQIKPNIYQWFFLDKNKKWVKYGNVDTANETNLVSSVASNDIEKHFLKNQYVPLTFQNASFSYTLDFVAMTQTNQSTKVIRDVRRRPEPHLKDEKQANGSNVSTGKTTESLPSTWDPMQPEERFRLIALSPTSTEYQTVLGLLKGRVANTNITKIERIQNPFLWKALQNKIKEMTTVYSDIKKVDVRQVFHGTRPDVISSICAENFDWRLHGSSTGQAQGRGTYFSPDAATSYGYCRADSAGLKYMFVARVAVGSITPGNASMARPPINPTTNAPYDSTGDGVSVIVKYDKQEYYPEYVLTLR